MALAGGRALTALRTALSAGFTSAFATFRRVYDDPSNVEGGVDLRSRAGYFQYLWALYDNSIFEDLKQWADYKGTYGLYRKTRSIYNPTRRLVDFYAGQVYPGVLSEDGSKLPDGVPLAIPLATDTPPALKTAIATFWRWTNWQAGKSVFVRYGAVTGNVLVEVVDDVDRGKVTANVVWPGLLAYIDLSPAGDVQAYALEYLIHDEAGLAHLYRKEVDRESFRYTMDGEPYDATGAGAQHANPYGFVPAVWAKHRDIGGNYGAPAMHGSLGKVDELASLASHVHDQIHKVIGAPVLFAATGGTGAIKNITGGSRKARVPTDQLVEVPDNDSQDLLILAGPADTKVHSLAGALSLGDTLKYMDSLQLEIKADHPELALYEQLRSMSQLTGPAAAKVMGDVASAVSEASANYDQASISLFRMAVAIGGWRVNNGDWGPLSRHQDAFRPFDLDSYARGDLDFDIMPRPLIQMTERERLEMDLLRASVAGALTTPPTVAANERITE